MKYDWDLIERLLHEVQNTADERFAPRAYAEELAAEAGQAGHPVDDLDALKAQATKYEAQLLKAGFIATRPESQGGNGENFVLTDRGLQLLSMIDSSFPGEQHPREVLDNYGLAALTPEVFEKIALEAV
ncbi:MAG: transcriptional regulator [Pseudomonas sp.]|nr:transcriptional regulator [Pseudomonas sp.]